MAQKLKFGNGTWATKEGSTLAYNDEGNNFKPLPFSFERDSIATRVNKEGLIEVVGKDIPRIDYTDSADGVLLLEPSRTNLVFYSEDFSNAFWTRSNATVISNNVISPDGTLNASSVAFTAGGYLLESLTTTKTIGSSETISVFSKTDVSGTFLKYGGGTASGTDVENKESFGNGWFRYSVTRTFTEAETASTQIIISSAEVGLNIAIFGAQLEAGSYPTSYISTSGSTVQRAAETANGSGNSEVFNDSEGVLYADISALADTAYIALGSDSNNRLLLGSSNSYIRSYNKIGGTLIDFTSSILASKNNKLAIKYKSGNTDFYINGFKVFESSTVFSATVVFDEIQFQNLVGNTQNFYGKTKEIGYYDTTLTDEELEYMTSYRSLNELVTELNLNTL